MDEPWFWEFPGFGSWWVFIPYIGFMAWLVVRYQRSFAELPEQKTMKFILKMIGFTLKLEIFFVIFLFACYFGLAEGWRYLGHPTSDAKAVEAIDTAVVRTVSGAVYNHTHWADNDGGKWFKGNDYYPMAGLMHRKCGINIALRFPPSWIVSRHVECFTTDDNISPIFVTAVDITGGVWIWSSKQSEDGLYATIAATVIMLGISFFISYAAGVSAILNATNNESAL